MTTILFEEKRELSCLCPESGCNIVCKEVDGDLWVEDYVGDNVLVWCPTHNEFLLCIGPCCISELKEAAEEHPCVKKMGIEDLKNYYKSRNLEEKDIPKFSQAYSVGLIRITDICCTSMGCCAPQTEDGEYDYKKIDSWEDDRSLIPYKTTNAIKLSDIKECDNDHRGSYLYYKGVCTVCENKTESKIWGD